jgi:hypothetical protein
VAGRSLRLGSGKQFGKGWFLAERWQRRRDEDADRQQYTPWSRLHLTGPELSCCPTNAFARYGISARNGIG